MIAGRCILICHRPIVGLTNAGVYAQPEMSAAPVTHTSQPQTGSGRLVCSPPSRFVNISTQVRRLIRDLVSV